jgi:hypothetical protein
LFIKSLFFDIFIRDACRFLVENCVWGAFYGGCTVYYSGRRR